MTEQDEKIAEIERALNAIDLNGPGPTEFAYIMLRNARYLLTELKAEREKRRKLNTRLAEAERLQELRTEWATLRLKLSGDIEDVGQMDMYGRGWCDAMAEALCRVRKLIDRTEAADETENK